MSDAKAQLLEKTYLSLIDMMFTSMRSIDDLESLVDKDIMAYGTAQDEEVYDIGALKQGISIQKKQLANTKSTYEVKNVFQKILNDGKSAVIVSEFTINFEVNNASIPLHVRNSSVFELIDEQWKVVHMHSSKPDYNAGGTDVFHINEWKNKNEALQKLVDEKTANLNQKNRELQKTLEELEATQHQLIQSEKLASLGQLAAGIAHEIKNPMNFIINFSELSLEYLDEIKEALAQLNQNETTEEIYGLLSDITDNLKKVQHHGSRADNIVKSMLMHARGGNGQMEPTDLNELVKEYVNLAFHGMRAGKNPINVKLIFDLDERIGLVPLNTEDFSRVILNLCKNAFDAMRTKSLSTENQNYSPALTLRTQIDEDQVVHLEIEDNGPGVSDNIKDKLFQPFFTTKRGTEGTGLGLSITNDIVLNHKGSIKISSEENVFTRFHIYLPQNQK